jgi:hypothetical protein
MAKTCLLFFPFPSCLRLISASASTRDFQFRYHIASLQSIIPTITDIPE